MTFKRMVVCDACDNELEMTAESTFEGEIRRWIQLDISPGHAPDSSVLKHLCPFCSRRLETVLTLSGANEAAQ